MNSLLCQLKRMKIIRYKHYFNFHRNYTSFEKNTIFALSTAPGVSAIAVIRISGPRTLNVFHKMGKLKKPPEARKAVLCRLNDPDTNELLDKALALWFPSPNSYTGEDLCELHIHGGRAVIKSVLNALQKLPNFRFAEPGEFTKRAFMAGKLDLTQVEALADLLNAETEAQQKQALSQMEGALFKLYTSWSGRLKKCLANLEAFIDFSEDQHLDNSIFNSVEEDLLVLKNEISSHLSDKRKGEKLRNGVNTVLIGQPNVGKSSLLNNLCKRDIAIVSSTAGTTRDLIESSLNLGGYLVNICDTAGIRTTCNLIEEEGVRRATERSSKADLRIFLIEAKRAIEILQMDSNDRVNFKKHLLTEELGENFIKNTFSTVALNSLERSEDLPNVIMLLNKVDLLSKDDMQKVLELERKDSLVCGISCTSNLGMEKFVNMLSAEIQKLCSDHCGEDTYITQERHRHHVFNCLKYILEYEDSRDLDIAIAADNLRNAMNELGKITGKVRIEDILDVVFQNFCIGK